MTDRFPMVCDSYIHLVPGDEVCDAFPQGIPLDATEAELHDEPRLEQDNNIVWEPRPDRRAQAQRDAFDKPRALVTGDQQ